MFATIYRPSRNAMQSGHASTRRWVLDFPQGAKRHSDPLMGWTSSTDTTAQLKLRFDSKEEAVAYAKKHGIPFRVTEKPDVPRRTKSYAANFSADRRQPWSH
ncbi:MAG: ETC complex I subunit [Maricaulis sp.]|jgi:hypothetical protein|nr:ETC complex I subunit [Maricaulis sp.]HAQ36266.1 ETC complex I subunit [Alphaproteobacteria bacterium]|tara:strand:+ start:224 stop:529 length:306 start_codon:yes stop_codon:yes gene_type:complete